MAVVELIEPAGAAAIGALAGPRIRAVAFRHGVPGAGGIRRCCPACLRPVLAPGWRGLGAVLPVTGRCPWCRGRIGPPPGAMEAAAGVLFASFVVRELPVPVLAGCWLGAAGLALVVVDAQVHRLPDAVTGPAFAGTVLGLAVAADREALLRALLAALVLGGGYLALASCRPTGLGMGDVKLAPALGSVLGWVGWPAVLVGTFLGFALAAAHGVALVLSGRAGRRHQIPFGPFMLTGGLAVLLLAGG